MSLILRLLRGSEIQEKEKATYLIQEYIQSHRFSKELQTFLSDKEVYNQYISATYMNIFKKSWVFGEQPKKEFFELVKLVNYNEEIIVLFLKHHCWKYNVFLSLSVKKTCDVLISDSKIEGMSHENNLLLTAPMPNSL